MDSWDCVVLLFGVVVCFHVYLETLASLRPRLHHRQKAMHVPKNWRRPRIPGAEIPSPEWQGTNLVRGRWSPQGGLQWNLHHNRNWRPEARTHALVSLFEMGVCLKMVSWRPQNSTLEAQPPSLDFGDPTPQFWKL